MPIVRACDPPTRDGRASARPSRCTKTPASGASRRSVRTTSGSPSFAMSARFDASDCSVPPWLPGGHSQTIHAALWTRRVHVSFSRERVDTLDSDFIDFDWAYPGRPLDSGQVADADHPPERALVLFHGLEGSSQSRYAQAIADHFRARGWVVAIPHFRGCSGTPNRLPRAYHSGDSDEVEFMLDTARSRLPQTRWYAVGVSLGGNALAKYLGERAE